MTVIMADADWQRAADAFDVPPEDIPHYQQAFTDIARLGLEAFAEALQVELLAVRAARLDGRPASPAMMHRLVIRQTVLTEVVGFVARDALVKFDGPKQ
jgi:hypothetical protein